MENLHTGSSLITHLLLLACKVARILLLIVRRTRLSSVNHRRPSFSVAAARVWNGLA